MIPVTFFVKIYCCRGFFGVLENEVNLEKNTQRMTVPILGEIYRIEAELLSFPSSVERVERTTSTDQADVYLSEIDVDEKQFSSFVSSLENCGWKKREVR